MDTLATFLIASVVTFFLLRHYLKTLANPKRAVPGTPPATAGAATPQTKPA